MEPVQILKKLDWQALDSWLFQHQALWQPLPFTEPKPSWAARFPELAQWLLELSEADYQFYSERLDLLSNKLSRWLPKLKQRTALIQLADFAATKHCALAEVDAPTMPGRKRLQAGAFTAALLPLDAPIFDWCCGSGHLARTLAPHISKAISEKNTSGKISSGKITGLEWDANLVAKGNQLAKAAGVAVEIQQQDVLQLNGVWPEQTHGVALHACGDLHRALLKKAVEKQLPRLSFSPCCYHLITSSTWQPLSKQAQNSQLIGLATSDLRLAVQETVTAPSRVTRQREALNAWRLGFDGLQRQVRQLDEYLPIASCSPKVLHKGFAAFCQTAAASQALTLPAATDFDVWETYGKQRLEDVKRYELLRHLFRRPLEIWLALDYQNFLIEAGYQVKLGTFCERALTPRNLLLDASLLNARLTNTQLT